MTDTPTRPENDDELAALIKEHGITFMPTDVSYARPGEANIGGLSLTVWHNDFRIAESVEFAKLLESVHDQVLYYRGYLEDADPFSLSRLDKHGVSKSDRARGIDRKGLRTKAATKKNYENFFAREEIAERAANKDAERAANEDAEQWELEG